MELDADSAARYSCRHSTDGSVFVFANWGMQRIVVLVLLTASALPCAAWVSTNVPLDHWSYDAVDKLAGYGLIDGAMLATKPISRIEMARHIAQAMHQLGHEKNPPAVLTAILERLKREFAEELALIGALDGPYGGSFVKPVEDPYVKYLHAQSEPDIENVRGDVFHRGSNYRAGFASRGQFFDRLAFYLHPEYVDSSAEDGDIDLIEGYGVGMVGPIEIEAGKDSMWWGPGYHGSILMSNNAAPFTMVKVTNPQPVQLPWIFKGLGPFRAEWFWTDLGEDRAIPRAKLSGIRINFKPTPLLEFGFSRVVMFGGHGVPRVGLRRYAKMFLAISEQAENNQLAGFDTSLLIPLGSNRLLRSVEVYTDAAGEDESGRLPSKWSYLLGVQLNDILRTGRTDVRFEYTDTHEVLYQHSLYTSGYTYKGRYIGDYIGPDARDLFIQVSHYLTEDLALDVSVDRQIRNTSGVTPSHRDIVECGLVCFPSRDWQVRAGYRYENGDAGEDDNQIVELDVIREF
jgi:hypothetical protein